MNELEADGGAQAKPAWLRWRRPGPEDIARRRILLQHLDEKRPTLQRLTDRWPERFPTDELGLERLLGVPLADLKPPCKFTATLKFFKYWRRFGVPDLQAALREIDSEPDTEERQLKRELLTMGFSAARFLRDVDRCRRALELRVANDLSRITCRQEGMLLPDETARLACETEVSNLLLEIRQEAEAALAARRKATKREIRSTFREMRRGGDEDAA